MPQTKLQNVVFTLLMAFVMVYAMICYNISLSMGGMSNQVFLMAFGELPIMWPVAFVLELLVVERLAQKLAFRLVTPGKDKPWMITVAISSMIVCLMCPMMSLVATILFKAPGWELPAVWVQTTIANFPMALFWQIFLAGPLVRCVFGFFTKRLPRMLAKGVQAGEES